MTQNTEEVKGIDYTTPVARLGFGALSSPSSYEGGEAKYSATLIFNQDQVAEMWNIINQLAVARWGADAATRFGNDVSPLDKLYQPLRPGSEKQSRDKPRPEFTGKFFINPKNKFQPNVFDRNNNIVSTSVAYSGCYVQARVRFFTFPAPGKPTTNKGVGVELKAIRFVDDGERLSSAGINPAANAAAFAAVPLPPVSAPAAPFPEVTPSAVPGAATGAPMTGFGMSGSGFTPAPVPAQPQAGYPPMLPR